MNVLSDFAWRTATAMNLLILPFAVLCGLVLASVAVSFVALFRAGSLAREAAMRSGDERAVDSQAMESLRREWQSLSAQLVEIRAQAAAVVPAPPKPGLNLNKRSQALRMHRRGDAPVEIALSLGIPLQEVDLLLKVHQIVISNI